MEKQNSPIEDPERKEKFFEAVLHEAIIQIKGWYGIDDLKNSEYLRLRNLAKAVMEQYSAKRETSRGLGRIEPVTEIVVLWPEREFGIPFSDIPKIKGTKVATEDFKVYLKRLRLRENSERYQD